MSLKYKDNRRISFFWLKEVHLIRYHQPPKLEPNLEIKGKKDSTSGLVASKCRNKSSCHNTYFFQKMYYDKVINQGKFFNQITGGFN